MRNSTSLRHKFLGKLIASHKTKMTGYAFTGFRWYDNKIDLTQVQPHYYVVRQVEPCHHLGWRSRALSLALCLNNNNPVSQWRFRGRLIIFKASLDDHRNHYKSKHCFYYPRGAIECNMRYLCGTGNLGYNRMRLPPTNRGICSGYKAMLRCTWVTLYVILPSVQAPSQSSMPPNKNPPLSSWSTRIC